ncbi:hypothetical protein AGMMS49938_15420 [Fibrobacterales bacterium]|nr:hypothetical protein AGMMS49938_15420 [Fibrobacterales bacterium]
MNRNLPIILIFLAIFANSATLQDVRFSCNSAKCSLEFPFRGEQGLPDYFQKFDSAKHILQVAFSKTEFKLKDGNYNIDSLSSWIKSAKVSNDKAKNLLYINFKCGDEISSDRNVVELRNKTNFVMSFNLNGKNSTKSWTLANIKAEEKIAEKTNEKSVLEGFSILPPHIAGVTVQRNSAWDELLIILDSQLPKQLKPEITDSSVSFAVPNAPEHSMVFQTANSEISKGFAWSEGKLTIYLKDSISPAILLNKNRILLQIPTTAGKLSNWKVLPTGLSSNEYYLPSNEQLAVKSAEFAQKVDKNSGAGKKLVTDKKTGEFSFANTIQVKRSDASYIVTEDITSLFPSAAEGRPLEALEFGDRLRILKKQPPFYKVSFNNREGFVYQRDVLPEADLTTSQKDKLRRLKKESPGGVDSIAAKFGWKDDDKITYSSYGFRDPFIEVRGLENDGINIDNLTLVGVVFENEMPMAVLSDNKTRGLSHTLHEGDSVKNGKILKISPNSVLFLLQEYGVSRRYTMSLPDRYGGAQ